jgi:hypothetical protein
MKRIIFGKWRLVPVLVLIVFGLLWGIHPVLADQPASGTPDTVTTYDTVPPFVISTSPSDYTYSVPVSSIVTATFDESLDPATINENTFTLSDGLTPANGTVTYENSTFTASFTPSSNLANGVKYTATLTTGITDTEGNALTDNFTWDFYTIPSASAVSIIASATAPAGGNLNVDIYISGESRVAAFDLTLDFDNTTLQPSGISETNMIPDAFWVYLPSGLPSGTIQIAGVNSDFGNATSEGSLVRIHFNVPGTEGKTSPLTISNLQVFEIYGQTIPCTKTDAMITVSAAQLAPAINSIIPNSGIRGTSGLPVEILGDNLTGTTDLTFSGNDIIADNLVVVSPVKITAVLNISNTAIPGQRDVTIITPGGTATLENGFTVLDQPHPVILSTNPANGEIDVNINSSITATFSLNMNPATLTADTFKLERNTDQVQVDGVVICSVETATFIPENNLSQITTYTALITTGVSDLYGNAMLDNYTWSFTTGSGVDITPPTVILTSPLDGGTGTAVDASVSATFSESVQASSLTSNTFTLKKGTIPVNGTVSYLVDTATFTPLGNLESSQTYTATVTTGVTDLAGNPLAGDFSWNFSTVAGSQTNLVTSKTPSTLGENITFTATVTGSAMILDVPDGIVIFFKDGLTELGSTALVSGQAALSTNALPIGSHSITAAYQGNSNYAASTSNTIEQVVNAPGLVITTDSLSDGDQKASYSETLEAENAVGSITWSIVKGSGSLPGGLKLNSKTGIITGKPTKTGDFEFQVKATDDKTSAYADLSIHINSAVTLTAPLIPKGEVDIEFVDWAPHADGGDGNYTWSISKGALPEGMELDEFEGTISGMPETAKTYSFTLKVTDGLEGFATKSFSLKVYKKLIITTETLPSADPGIAYKFTLKATGGSGKYTWSVPVGEDIPDNFTLTKGVIKFTTNDESRDYTFTMEVNDGTGTAQQLLTLTVNDPLEIDDPGIPDQADVEDAWDYELAATGGNGIYKWSVTGKLPKGIKLVSVKNEDSTRTYYLKGTLTKEGSYTFTLKVTDGLKLSKTLTLTTQVNPLQE